MSDKEWIVEFTITGRTSFYSKTKKEAEKEAKEYLSEVCRDLYPGCDSNDYEIDDIYTYEEDEEE